MDKVLKLGFAIQKIETRQFAIIDENYNSKGSVGMKVGLNFEITPNERIIAVALKIHLTQKNDAFLVSEIACSFEIAPDSWKLVFNPKENFLDLPKDFVAHITSLTIGSMRGFIHAKTEGNQINKHILPTINITELVKTDLHLNLIPNKDLGKKIPIKKKL